MTSGRLSGIRALLLLLALAALPELATAQIHGRRRRPEFTQHLLVKPGPSLLARGPLQPLSSLGLQRETSVGSQGWRNVRVEDGEDVAAKMLQLRHLGYMAEHDWILRASVTRPNDNLWSSISAAMNMIRAPAAWDLHRGSAKMTVCVIDSGVNLGHPDLRANVDQTKTYNAIFNVTSPKAGNDDYGHGSHCSGTIGAVGNNSIGVAGVNWRIRILACKFLKADGEGTETDAVRCIHWCRDQNASITSNSWAGGLFSTPMWQEISASEKKGHLFIAAAGNDGRNIDSQPVYPAAYNNSNIITVGAYDPMSKRVPSWSNYGAKSVDLFAPGVGITSTILGSKYDKMDGTSMACPHVAGAAALLWSYRPSLKASDVKDTLLKHVDVLSNLKGKCVTRGHLNLEKAMRSVTNRGV